MEDGCSDGKGTDVVNMEFGSLRSDGDLVQAISEVAIGDNLVSIEATDYGDVGGGEDDFTITAQGGRNTAQIDTGDSRLAIETEGQVHVQAKKQTKKRQPRRRHLALPRSIAVYRKWCTLHYRCRRVS